MGTTSPYRFVSRHQPYQIPYPSYVNKMVKTKLAPIKTMRMFDVEEIKYKQFCQDVKHLYASMEAKCRPFIRYLFTQQTKKFEKNKRRLIQYPMTNKWVMPPIQTRQPNRYQMIKQAVFKKMLMVELQYKKKLQERTKPIESPIESPIEEPIEPPIKSPIEPPIKSPIEAPIEPPIEVLGSIQVGEKRKSSRFLFKKK